MEMARKRSIVSMHFFQISFHPRGTTFNPSPFSYNSRFHPSSTIKVAIYRESRTHISIAKHLVGQHVGKIVDLLDDGVISEHVSYMRFNRKPTRIDATVDLKDKTGRKIASDAKIKINLSLVPESEDTFKSFMKSVDEDVSRLENATQGSATTPALGVLGKTLQLTKNIMDIVASVRRFSLYLISHRSDWELYK